MSTIVIGEEVRVPPIADLEAFRQWTRSDDFPQHGWFSHLDGELWVDLSMERAAHNRIKNKIGFTLDQLASVEQLGVYFGDRMLLTNVEVGLSTEPDGMFLSNLTLEKG